MLSIDEVIARERQQAKKQRSRIGTWGDEYSNKKCEVYAEYHEQLAEWLEELKVIKDGSIPIIHGKAELELHDKAIRNKALDDFVGRLIEELSHTTLLKDGYYLANIIKPLAEQLKEQEK